MLQKKYFYAFVCVVLLFVFAPLQQSLAYSDGTVLRKGMSSAEVRELQGDLRTLGVFSIEPTGYYGDITRSAVIRFQSRYGLMVDGIAGPQTIGEINRLLGRTASTTARAATTASRGTTNSGIELMPWYGRAEVTFSIGSVATVTDVDTGLQFKVKRTYGYNHADVETLTAADTAIMKKVAGGSWNWVRRAIIVEVNGHRIAASMAPMPHAGRDDMPANVNVSNRSEGYGYGTNLDTVKGNNMDGHFDIHFYQSKTHATNRVNPEHQAAVQKAYRSGN